jgi:glycolate oxidase FAD binding subunit
MKLNHDQLGRQLESVLGAGSVIGESTLLASYTVDGTQPVLFCAPETAEQVAAALRVCSEAQAVVTPWGGGAAIVIGNLPLKVEVIIGLNKLTRLIEHDDANLTATLAAGITVANVQDVVARRNQFLPFDPPQPARATIGGTIAANLNGPRRSCYGSVRDLVIGMRVALASGEQIKAGGKVVKNVAGYDMCKLFVGSLGTLGIITEVTLRMAPIPETAATLIATGTLPQAVQLAGELACSPLLPPAVFLLSPQVSKSNDIAQKDWQVAVWADGFEQSVARHLRDVRVMAEHIGLVTEILREAAHRRLWDTIRDFLLPPEGVVYRLTVPRALAPEVIKTVSEWKNGLYPAMACDLLAGTLWIMSSVNHASAKQFSELISLARAHGGHAIMLAGPPALKEDIDVWGAPPAAFSLMREIKRQFDPKGIINPGRFVGGI